jgi:hypothetical protein
VLAKGLHRRIRAHMVRWCCSPPLDTSIHGPCGGGGGVGEESPPSDTSVHGSCGGGGGVLRRIRVYTVRRVRVGVEEMMVFSLIAWRGGGVLHHRIRGHTARVEEVVVLAKSRIRAHIALEKELVVLARVSTLENERMWLILKVGGGGARWWLQRVSILENECMRLVFKGGGGGGVGKESPPLKTSVRGLFSWMVVVCQ